MISLLIIILLSFLFLLIVQKIKYKTIKILFFLISIVLGIVAYNVNPYNELDLYRHFNMLDNIRSYGFAYIINHNDFKNLPVGAIYFYVISLFNNNHLLPAITTFIYYYSILRITCELAKKFTFNKTSIWLAVISFLFISNFLGVASGIRNPLCMAIFCYVFYKDIFDGWSTKKCYILYFLLCLFHPSCIILLVLRMLINLPKNATKIISLILLFWSSLKWVVTLILTKFSNFSFVNFILQKFTAYDINEAQAVANTELYTLVYLTVYIVFIISFILYRYKLKNNNNQKIQKYNVFLTYILCFCIGSIFEYHYFVRFSRVANMLMIFPIMYLLTGNKTENNLKKYNWIIFLMILFESLMLLIFYIQGQYSIL